MMRACYGGGATGILFILMVCACQPHSESEHVACQAASQSSVLSKVNKSAQAGRWDKLIKVYIETNDPKVQEYVCMQLVDGKDEIGECVWNSRQEMMDAGGVLDVVEILLKRGDMRGLRLLCRQWEKEAQMPVRDMAEGVKKEKIVVGIRGYLTRITGNVFVTYDACEAWLDANWLHLIAVRDQGGKVFVKVISEYGLRQE